MQELSIPPTAAIIGNKACLIFESSPCKNSLLISKVTKKKEYCHQGIINPMQY
jgi:hypothetical protein